MKKINIRFMRVRLSIKLIFLLLIIFPGIVEGAEHDYVVIKSDFTQINLGKYLDILVDNSNLLTIEDVCSPEFNKKFISNTKDSLIIGPPSQQTVWVRFVVKTDNNGISSPEYLYLELGRPRYKVDFFQPSRDNPSKFIKKSINGKEQLTTGDVDFRHLTFQMDTQGHSSMTYYVRLEVFGPEFLFFMLRSCETFHDYTRYDYLIYGLMYGVLLSMVLYNFFIFVTLKDKIYLYYVLYISFFLLYLILYMGHLSLFVQLKINTALALESAFLGGLIFFSAIFCRKFFNANLKTPFWNKLLYFNQIIGCCSIAACLIGEHTIADIAANLAGITGPVTFLGIGIIRWRQGFKPAGFFILANIFFILGTTTYILWLTNVLTRNLPGELFFTLGPVLESVLLSFSLAYRISTLEKERLSLVRSRDIYKYASETDGLTNLYNKQYLFECLSREIEEADHSKKPISLIMMDLDDFKKYNDAYGHPEGDVVLKVLAGLITSQIRDSDYGCRYGGEEFTIILPKTNIDDAFRVAERIRKNFSLKKFQPVKGNYVSTTVSISAALHNHGESPDTLITRADKALYIAKRKGKNITQIAY